MAKGCIYVLTNPSFPNYVKIGYADNVDKRLEQLNQSECIPFAFRLYAYYEVDERLTDKKIHDMIDKLNPNLRSIDTFNGKPRKREFYAISKETAYNILESIAFVSSTTSRLHLKEDDSLEKETESDEIDKIKYDINTFLSNKTDSVIKMYQDLSSLAKLAIPGSYEETTPNYIALRNPKGKTICEFHLLRSKLTVMTRIPRDHDLMIGEKVPDTYLWTLNYRIYVNDNSIYDKVISVIVDASEQLKS